MWEKIKNIRGDSVIKTGVFTYLLGFILLFFVGQDYTGFFSFLAPFSIIAGVVVISIGLAR